jgi:anti-sigma B factor antagonist
MQLALQSQKSGNVVVIRCAGRIVIGEEARALQSEIDQWTLETKRFVLDMSEVSYVDSGGLGALVRLSGVLRAGRGGLKLCRLSPFVLQVLEATTLHRVFQTYASEKEAIEAFLEGPHAAVEEAAGPRTKVLCIDTSSDLLAYLNALLKRVGYEVLTTQHISDARTLVKATRPSLVICGPGLRTNEAGVENLRQSAPGVHLMLLPPDFSSTEASQAGSDLVGRIQSLLKPTP